MKIEITKTHLGIFGGIAAIGALIGTIGAALASAKSAESRANAAYEKAVEMEVAINRMSGAVDKAIEDLASKASIDIPEHIMNAAIEKAATEACNREARLCANGIRHDMKSRIFDSVDSSVKAMQVNAEVEVKNEFKRQVSSINIRQFKADVCREVKEDLVKKAGDEVDRVTSAFINQVEQQTSLMKKLNEKMLSTNA